MSLVHFVVDSWMCFLSALGCNIEFLRLAFSCSRRNIEFFNFALFDTCTFDYFFQIFVSFLFVCLFCFSLYIYVKSETATVYRLIVYIYIYIYIYIWKHNMKSLSNETLNILFRRFCFSFILDLAKTNMGSANLVAEIH